MHYLFLQCLPSPPRSLPSLVVLSVFLSCLLSSLPHPFTFFNSPLLPSLYHRGSIAPVCPSVRPSLRFIIRELCSGFPLVHPSYPLCEPCSELSTALRALLHHRGTSVPVCPSVRPSLWIIPPCASRRSISHCAFRTSLVAAPFRRSAPLPSSACFTFGLPPDKRRHSAQLIAKLFNFALFRYGVRARVVYLTAKCKKVTYMWLTSRHLEGGTAEIRFVVGSGRVWLI